MAHIKVSVEMKMKYILLGLLSFLLLACNQEVQTKNAVSSEKHSHKHFIGKPQAAISMHYEYLNSKEINKELEIKLVFKVSHDTDALYVNYRVNPGLKLLNSQTEFQFNKLSKGASNEIVLRIIPEMPGQQIIYITAAIDVNGSQQSRAFMVPVSTGSTEQLKSQQITSPKGTRYIPSQNVISMPATETSK